MSSTIIYLLKLQHNKGNAWKEREPNKARRDRNQRVTDRQTDRPAQRETQKKAQVTFLSVQEGDVLSCCLVDSDSTAMAEGWKRIWNTAVSSKLIHCTRSLVHEQPNPSYFATVEEKKKKTPPPPPPNFFFLPLPFFCAEQLTACGISLSACKPHTCNGVYSSFSSNWSLAAVFVRGSQVSVCSLILCVK